MTKTIRSLLVLAVLACLAGAVSFAESGEAIYKSKCAMCHGASGVPSPGMAKMLGIKPAPDYKNVSTADMMNVVKSGKGKMKPVSGLSDAQVKEVVAYFHTLTK